MWSIPATGGEDARLFLAADTATEKRFQLHSLLPDGRILVGIWTAAGRRIEVIAPDGTGRTTAPDTTWTGVVDDILFYRQGGQLWATRFDSRRLESTGTPIALSDKVRPARSVASTGGGRVPVELAWVSPTGDATPTGLPPDVYQWPRLSPDGSRLVTSGQNGMRVIDLRSQAETPLAQVASTYEPVWSFDSRQIYFGSGGTILRQSADGGSAPDTVVRANLAAPTSVSPDGEWLAYYAGAGGEGTEGNARGDEDLFFFNLSNRETRHLELPGSQRGARFSPAGRWVAYQSRERGRDEVYIRSWPLTDASFRVSADGGTEPAWSPGGRELYYRHAGDIMAVTVTPRGAGLDHSLPRVLFTGNYPRDPNGDQSYDVAKDGRFLLPRLLPGQRHDVRVTFNWIAEVRARLEKAQ